MPVRIFLDSRHTLQTRRHFSSSEPKDLEELASKYEVMSSMWLLSKQRQPGRALFDDLHATTCTLILKELRSKRNFNLKKELVDVKYLPAPPWQECLSYEYELRRDACKRCRDTTSGFKAARWATYQDQEHRMCHWLQLVSRATPISRSSASSSGDASRIAKLEKEIAATVAWDRSRTPPRKVGLPKGER